MLTYQSNESGKLYLHLAIGVDHSTNNKGSLVNIYHPIDNEHEIFIMESNEFESKFKNLTELDNQ